MPESMQIVRLYMVGIMPVIEKIVMKKRASYQFVFLTSDSHLLQLITDKKTVFCYIHAMPVDSHASMLNMPFGLFKIFGFEDI